MILHKLPGYLLVAALALAVGCNSEKPAEDPSITEVVVPSAREDTTVVDTLTSVEEDGVSVESPTIEEPVATPPESRPPESRPPASQEQRPPQKAQPQPERVEEPPVADAGTFQEGTYRLVQVQGESLPMVLYMTTDCDTNLLRGELTLKDGEFNFQSYTAEECSGNPGNEEKHEASGSYQLEGNQLSLNIRYGDALGDARGVVEGNEIRLQHIGNAEEEQEVDWLLRRQ